MSALISDPRPGSWRFEDDEGSTQGWYDTEVMREWLRAGYLTTDTQVQQWSDNIDADVVDTEEFQWLGLVDELTCEGMYESSWYYKTEEDSEACGPFGIYILHAWLVNEMLDYDTLYVKCASTGSETEDRRSDWDSCGVYDNYALLKDIPNVFAEESENGAAQNSSAHDADKTGQLSTVSVASISLHQGLEGGTIAERNNEFFNLMKAEKEEMARKRTEERQAKLDAMSEEERTAFLVAEEKKAIHAKKKEKMLKSQLKGMKAKGIKGLKKGGRGRARTSTKTKV